MSPSSLSADVFVGSLAAEVATKMLVHPLDTLKTRLQYLVVPRRATVTRRQWLPLISDVALGLELLTQATRSPHHSLVDPPLLKLTRGSRLFNGLRSLYRGIGPQLLGVLPISVVYMPSYELASSIFRETPLQFTPAAGVVTGVVSAVVRVPVSVIKSRMQLGLHQSGAEALAHATRRSGAGLYAGFRATVVLDATYAAVQFGAIEQLRRLALSSEQARRPTNDAGAGVMKHGEVRQHSGTVGDASQLSTATNAFIGFATGVIAAVITEPIDVIRTRLMTQQQAAPRGFASGAAAGAFAYEGLVHGVRCAAATEGTLALWKGLLPRLMTKSVGSLIWYTTYMETRKWYVGVSQGH